MKITKLGHCCLLVGTKGKRIVTDPGFFSSSQNDLTNIDAVIITHEHEDHLHIPSLVALLLGNEGLKVFTNSTVGKKLKEKGIAYETLENGEVNEVPNLTLESVEGKHEEIFEEIGNV